MANSKRFKDWHKMETARRMQKAHTIEAMIKNAVDRAMQPENIRIEYYDPDDKRSR
jgi:hypothetical protein